MTDEPTPSPWLTPMGSEGVVAYSDVLSTIALAVSLLTALAGVIMYFRWERPVVSVSGRQRMSSSHGSPTVWAEFILHIVNTGNQATQLVDAYWEIEIVGQGSTQLRGDGTDGTTRLERHQLVEVVAVVDVHAIVDPSKWVRARPVAVYTSRKKVQTAFGEWELTQIAQNVSFINSTRPPSSTS